MTAPRCVLVERPTEYAELLARHATREQVRFFLEQRGRSLDEVAERHEAFAAARRSVLGAVPPDWRQASVLRDELDRFLFAPEDVVVVLGQDGLVANTAKYLAGQPVVGLNPDPERFPGVLVRHPGRRRRRPGARRRGRARAGRRAHDGLRAGRRRPLAGRAERDLRRPRVAPERAVRPDRRRPGRAPVVLRAHRHHRDGATGWAASIARERAGAAGAGGVPPPRDRATTRWRSSCARRGRARRPARR
jgi:hypothetical protein